MLAPAALSTKMKVTAPLVAAVQALTSSARATLPPRNTRMGRTGHRSVRPLLCDALYLKRGALLVAPVWSLPQPKSHSALSITSPASVQVGRRVTIGLRSRVGWQRRSLGPPYRWSRAHPPPP